MIISMEKCLLVIINLLKVYHIFLVIQTLFLNRQFQIVILLNEDASIMPIGHEFVFKVKERIGDVS